MEWWTHLWLKEGFANWIEYLCVDHTHPEFEVWTYFLHSEYGRAANLDSLANSHPIEVGENVVVHVFNHLRVGELSHHMHGLFMAMKDQRGPLWLSIKYHLLKPSQS